MIRARNLLGHEHPLAIRWFHWFKFVSSFKSPTRLERPPNELPKLKRFLDRLARDGEPRACYKASGAGQRR